LLPVHERFQLALSLQVEPIDHVFGDHDEQSQVNGINAFAEDGSLPAALAQLGGVLVCRLTQEGSSVLKVVASNHAPQSLAGLQRLTISRVDITDLALRHGHQGNFMDAILPAPKPQVKSTAEKVHVIAGFIIQSDDAAFLDGAFRGPQLLHDADAAVRNV